MNEEEEEFARIVFQQSSSNVTTIWTLNSMNDASPTFGEGQISYYTSSTYQITLDLLTNGGRGYVALDDFTFKPGMCRGQFSFFFLIFVFSDLMQEKRKYDGDTLWGLKYLDLAPGPVRRHTERISECSIFFSS